MNHKALETPFQGIFILLVILVQCSSIDIHVNFDVAIHNLNGPTVFLGGIGESALLMRPWQLYCRKSLIC